VRVRGLHLANHRGSGRARRPHRVASAGRVVTARRVVHHGQVPVIPRVGPAGGGRRGRRSGARDREMRRDRPPAEEGHRAQRGVMVAGIAIGRPPAVAIPHRAADSGVGRAAEQAQATATRVRAHVTPTGPARGVRAAPPPAALRAGRVEAGVGPPEETRASASGAPSGRGGPGSEAHAAPRMICRSTRKRGAEWRGAARGRFAPGKRQTRTAVRNAGDRRQGRPRAPRRRWIAGSASTRTWRGRAGARQEVRRRRRERPDRASPCRRSHPTLLQT